MRPATLAEAVERIVAGAPADKAISEFVDTFDLTPTKSARYARIETEPVLTADDELNAFVGGVAEYLAKQRKLGRVPGWAADPCRRLAQPHFIPDIEGNAMREYLTFASPAEFASRNIFTDERPLRRARGPAPGKPDIV